MAKPKSRKPFPNITAVELQQMSNEDCRNSVQASSLSKYKSGFKCFAKFCVHFKKDFNPQKKNLCEFISCLQKPKMVKNLGKNILLKVGNSAPVSCTQHRKFWLLTHESEQFFPHFAPYYSGF